MHMLGSVFSGLHQDCIIHDAFSYLLWYILLLFSLFQPCLSKTRNQCSLNAVFIHPDADPIAEAEKELEAALNELESTGALQRLIRRARLGTWVETP